MLRSLIASLLIAGFIQAAASAQTRVVIVVGPSNHPPGTHEVAAGGRLLQHCLENMINLPGVKAEVFTEWPKDEVLDSAATIVFIGDNFPPHRLPNSKAIMEKLDAMMKRGCGIVCIHFATGVPAGNLPPDGDHPLLRWMGGYFSGGKHHQSIAKIFPKSTITPAAEKHPVCRGWREFTVNDEPYINNYFGKDGNKPAANVTPLAVAMLPPEAPKRETVAWGVDRPDGGRGFGIVMPHFYRNWSNEDVRRFILNGIAWTAKLEVPEGGVQTASPDLESFKPVSVDPKPASPKPATRPKP